MVYHGFPPEYFCHHFLQRTLPRSWWRIDQIHAYSTNDRQLMKVFFPPLSWRRRCLLSQLQRRWVNSYFALDLAPDKLLKLYNFQVMSQNTLSQRSLPHRKTCRNNPWGFTTEHYLCSYCQYFVPGLFLFMWILSSLFLPCESPPCAWANILGYFTYSD